MDSDLTDVQTDIFYLAPLRGVTGRVFRYALARHFTAPDLAVAPFIPTFAGKKIAASLLRDIDPGCTQAIPVIPQVIGKDPDQLRVLLRAFRDLGYTKADLNAGCPWPFVAKKGRGSGLLAHPEALEAMVEAGCEEMPGGFSVKVRLGIKSPDMLMERVEMLNRYPLREITIHPRTARQMYEGKVDLEAFGEAAALCRHPVVYNGDICTLADWRGLKARFPSITRWMIGRGLAMNPALMEAIRQGVEIPRPEPERLSRFLATVMEETGRELSGRGSVLGRMKELWSYLHRSFPRGETIWKAIRICRTVEEYTRVTARYLGG